MTVWSEALADIGLQALLAVVRNSPIILRPILRPNPLAEWSAEWSKVRKSGNADAFVLAWIASHARERRRAHRVLM